MAPQYQIIVPNVSQNTFDIYDETVDLITLEGIGIPPITRKLIKSVGIWGANDKGFSLEPRRMDLRVFFSASTPSAIEAKRDEIYKIFKPFDYPLRLKVTRDDGSIREIQCHTEGIVEIPDSEIFGRNAQSVAIRLVAPDPTWYEPVTNTSQNVIVSSGGTFTLAAYNGNWQEYPILRMNGQITNPDIRLEVSHKDGEGTTITRTYRISITANIANATYYDIDLRPGKKTIKDNLGADKMSTLDSINSDWGEFRIFPNQLGVMGNWRVFYSAKNSNARLDIIYKNRFIAI